MRRAVVACLLGLFSVIGCVHKSNRLIVSEIYSPKLDEMKGFSVLRAPPGEGVDPAELPVVLFLHGMGSDHQALDKYGVSDALYDAMIRGAIPRVHLILPDGEAGFYLNWYDGTHPYEDYILQEVLPAAEKLLGVAPDRSRRHIAGVSMGGTGAIQIGLRHPELFTSITCLSGLIMTKEQAAELMDTFLMRLFAPVKRVWGYGCDERFADGLNAYLLIQNRSPGQEQQLFIAFGDEEHDQIRSTGTDYHEFLESQGVDHEFVVYEGGHGWQYWVPLIEQAIRYVLKPSS